MKDLYKGFKKVAEDDASAKLQHENGHELVIAKSGLNKSMKKMLENLPLHQAEGTKPMEQIDEPQSEPMARKVGRFIKEEGIDPLVYDLREGYINPLLDYNARLGRAIDQTMIEPTIEFGKGLLGVGDQQPVQQKTPTQPPVSTEPSLSETQAAPQKTLASTEQPQPQVSTAKPTTEPAEPALTRQEKMDAAMASLQTPSEQAMTPGVVPPEKVKPLTDDEIIQSPNTTLPEKQLAVTRMYQKNLKELTQKAEDERQKIKEIDPNRLWNSLDTWGKIRNTIALILGGVGGGLTHQENPAAKALDRMIEEDVNAQKEDNTNRTNLYKFHLDRLKDSQAAYEATMKNLKDAVINQIEIDNGLQPGKPIYNQMLNNKRLAMLVDEGEKLQKLADLKTMRDTQSLISSAKKQAVVGPQGAVALDPDLLTSRIKDDKERERIKSEIQKRKKIKKLGPEIMDTVDRVVKDLSGLKGPVSWIKTPESKKDLELLIRGIIPDVADREEQAAKEVKVQALLRLLNPEWSDVAVGDTQPVKDRVARWMTQNLLEDAKVDGLDLNQFESTRISPETWQKPQRSEAILVSINNQKPKPVSPKDLEKMQEIAKQRGDTITVLKK